MIVLIIIPYLRHGPLGTLPREDVVYREHSKSTFTNVSNVTVGLLNDVKVLLIRLHNCTSL